MMANTAARKITPGAAVIGVAVICGLVVLKASLHVVPAGHRAVVFNSVHGIRQVSLREGLNVITPFLDHPIDYEVRTRSLVFTDSPNEPGDCLTGAVNAKTADSQTVTIDLTVRYRVDPDRVWQLHQSVGRAYEDSIVKPTAGGAARDIVAAYRAEAVYSAKRQEIQDTLTANVATALADYGIVLDEVLLRNVEFTPEYHKAIESKQIRQQQAQKKQYELDREQQEKRRKIIEAEGQAKAMAIRGRALASYPAVVQYEYVQGLPTSVPTYVVGGNTIVGLSDLFRRQEQAR